MSNYKELSLLKLQLQSLREDIPLNLKERRGDVKDLEMFDMKISAMQKRLDRAINKIK